MQQHQRAGAFGIERAAMQQIGESADGGEAVVQGIENVGRAFVEDDVLDLGRGLRGGLEGRWWE